MTPLYVGLRMKFISFWDLKSMHSVGGLHCAVKLNCCHKLILLDINNGRLQGRIK